MNYKSIGLCIVATSLLISISACESDTSKKNENTANADHDLTYGTDEYFRMRIAKYNESDMMRPEYTMTRDNLPWDPNGPTMPVDELQPALDNIFGGVFPGGFDQQVAAMCANDPRLEGYEYESGRTVDKAIGNLRLGGITSDPSVLVDVSGGFECGDGRIVTGSGQPIFSQLQTDTLDRWTFDVPIDDHTLIPPLIP